MNSTFEGFLKKKFQNNINLKKGIRKYKINNKINK